MIKEREGAATQGRVIPKSLSVRDPQPNLTASGAVGNRTRQSA
jgi:hypothetical protein